MARRARVMSLVAVATVVSLATAVARWPRPVPTLEPSPPAVPAGHRVRAAQRTATLAVPRVPAWIFRLSALNGVLLAVGSIRVVRELVWDDGVVATGWLHVLVSYLAILWALPAVPCGVALVGLTLHRGPSELGGRRPVGDPNPRHCDVEVCFRIVSRGTNVEALRSTVENVRREMEQLPLFPWSLEVVSDRPVELPVLDVLRPLVVPDAYETPTKARYKARALQYALDVSPIDDRTWLFHLDEESHLHPSVIVGIRDAVLEEEASGRLRIGQGAILYHRKLEEHPFLTLADSIRTGDDISRFHAQHRLGFTLFGLHGSFILVRNDIERTCGFDIGPEGSVTEDAFWAVQQMALGRRSRWVDGYVVEQSTQSFADFVRQRRRWFAGMVNVVLYADTPAWIRVPLALFTALWSVSWLGMLFTIANLFLGLRTPPIAAALGDLALSTYVVSYLLGLWLNLRDRPALPVVRRVGLYLLQLAALPAFSLMEAAGVVAAVVRPERGFHIVRK